MSRPEGPTKTQRIDDLMNVMNAVALKLGTPVPKIHRGMWYNIDRSGIEDLIAFLLPIIVEEKPDALDKP